MAREIYAFHVTVPINTPAATPQVTNLTMPQRQVDRVEVRVPPGPRGEVGFALGSSGVAVIPLQANTYIVTDNEALGWDLEDFWTSGGWQAFLYNTGAFSHTIEIRFLVSLPPALQAAAAGAPSTGPLSLTDQQFSTDLTVPPVPSDLTLTLPTISLPPAPTLPVLSVPLPPMFPGPPTAAPQRPTFTVTEDDRMRYAELAEANGTKHFFVLLSNYKIDHWSEQADTTPLTREYLPGDWLAMRQPFLYGGNLVVRGLGTDGTVWQTIYDRSANKGWSDPTLVLG